MSILGEKTVLAVDPGTTKCGFAVVRRTDQGLIELIWRAIVPTEEIAEGLAQAQAAAAFSMIIVGTGTRSRAVITELQEILPSIGILTVDEKETTLKARERYWIENPRRGWRKFLPATLQTPPEPVDDFVALILAERVLNA